MLRFPALPALVATVAAVTLARTAPAAAQPVLDVRDAFTDGDFTRDPAWTSPEPLKWVVAPRGGNPALITNGGPTADTLTLSTPSNVSVGTWRFRFGWTGVNLSTANGARVFLVSDRADVSGAVRGYALQFGTTNTDDVRLVRFDGDASVPANRVLLGQSAVVLAGDAGEVSVDVTRSAAGVWTVSVTGAPPFTATDPTYFGSAALGLWVKHSSTGGRSYALDDIEVTGTAGPPDTTAPRLADVALSDVPPEIALTFSEPVAAATLTPSAVALTPALPFTLLPTDAGAATPGVRLVFGAPLPLGRYTLALGRIADPAGNVLRDTTVAVVVARDETPPAVTSARFTSARTLVLGFSEPAANACAAAAYTVTRADGGAVPVASATCPNGALVTTATLTLAADVAAGSSVTVAATGLRDAAGNTGTSALVATRPDEAQAGDVVVNEVMSAPPTGGTEWVEILNRSSRTLDLADLRLSDAVAVPRAFSARPVVLAPGAYAVAVQDSIAFATAFPSIPPGITVVRVSPWPGLNNDADAVVLRRADGLRIDSVAYTAAWGTAGRSLERRDPSAPPVRVNFAATLDPRGGTPGARNSVYALDTAGPVALRAERIGIGASAEIRVVFDEPVDTASLTGAFSTDVGTPIAITADGDGSAVRLGGVGGAARVTVTGVRDGKGNASGMQPVVVAAPPTAGSLAVVEAMLAPRTSGAVPQVEYLEILNTATTALALRSLVLVARAVPAPGDDPASPDTTRFNDADRTLPPGGRLIVYDSDPTDGPDAATASRFARGFPDADLRAASVVLVGRSTVTSGGLANAGECLTLLSIEGAARTVVAPETCVLGAYADPSRTPGASLERLTPTSDGPLGWASSHAPGGGTPGATNAAAPLADASGDPSALRISEILYQPLADSRDARADQAEFVEVVNTGAAALDLNGLVLLGAPDERGRRDSVRLAYGPLRLAPGAYAAAFHPTTSVPDGAAFRAAFASMPPDAIVLAAPGLSLRDSGDRLALRRLTASGGITGDLDAIRYAPEFHSAALRTTTGISLERLALDRAADEASAWASSPSPDGATPGALNAVSASAATAPERAGIAASPSPFSPDGDGIDDAATFAYRLRGAASSVRLRVFDAEGRLVRTLPPAPAGQTGVLAWDGADDAGRALPIGIYIALLDAIDERGGRAEMHRAVVTLARRL